MGNLEVYYYKLNVSLLSIIGLWPGESTILRRMQNASYSFIMAMTLIVQLIPFITMQYHKTLVLHNIPMITVAMGSILKYFTFFFQSDYVKEITELVKRDWSTTKDDEELRILIRHASVGKFYTTAFAKFWYPSVMAIILSQYAPLFLDLVVPLNETRSLQFFITFEVFIDQQKYFYIITLGLDVACFALITVYLATESMYMMWLKHQVSQYEIYAYRIRTAFLGDPVKMHILDRNARIIKILASALDMHNRTILFNLYMRKFWWSYIIQLGLGVALLSVVLYRLSILLKTLDKLNELIMCTVFVTGGFGYMYYISYMMQQVINSYDNVSSAIYDTNWYAAPMCAQKMLLFIMLKNTRTLKKKVYGLFEPALEGFIVNAKVTFSYFTLIYSTR